MIHSPVFAGFMDVAIVVNSIQMGVQADLRDESYERLWNVFEHIFTLIFAAEMVLRIAVLREVYFKEYWNLLDFLIAWVSIVYAWILPVVYGDRTNNNLSVIKVFRLLRLFRMLKLVKAIPEFRGVIEGMLASLRALFWVCLLLLVTVYTFAILCVEVVGTADANVYPGHSSDVKDIQSSMALSNFNNYEFFGDLGRAMVSLFSISLLAEWDAIRAMWEFQRPCVLFIFPLIFLTSFGIVNVIIGVIVESTNVSMQEMHAKRVDWEKQLQMMRIELLAENIWMHDADSNGEISMEEMRTIGANPEVCALLDELDLPKGFTFDDLFTLLNIGGCNEMSKKSFLTGMQRLIFSTDFQKACLQQLATSEIQALHMDLHKLISDFHEATVERHFKLIRGELSVLRRQLRGRGGSCELDILGGEAAEATFTSHSWSPATLPSCAPRKSPGEEPPMSPRHVQTLHDDIGCGERQESTAVSRSVVSDMRSPETMKGWGPGQLQEHEVAI